MIYSDKPISSNKDDLLNRGGFARLLAHSLINLNNTDTFTVGLFGKWGSGKTSLVNMMLQEIEHRQKDMEGKDKLIIVHFEPWNFSDTNQLLTQFFVRLSNEFRSKGDENLAKVGEALEKYSDAFEIAEVIPVVGGLLALLGKKGASALGKNIKKGSDEKDILKQKEYVARLLEKQANKILVVIDDIDRLSNEQIRQVFQLITSVAKFPNTTYLLVFDKEIVVKALEKVQEGSGEDYLEKVIQMPIQIPDIQKTELRKTLFNRLDRIISVHEDLLFSATHWQRLFEPCIEHFVKNLRDINRLCNTVQFKLTTISSEVEFTDMVAISVLEIYLPAVYEWVKANKAILTGDNDLSSIGIKNKSQKEWYEFYHAQILLLQNDKQSGMEKSFVETTITFLTHLFPYFGQRIGKAYETYDINQFRRNNQIAHPGKFDRYFHLNLDYISIKKLDIINVAQTANCDELIAYILKLDQNGNSYEFLEEVKAIITEISPDRAKIIVEALIKASSRLDTILQKSLLSLSASSYAVHLINELIATLQSEERFVFISNTISNADLYSLQVCATVINMLELSYGRLAANGKERDDKKIITLEELIKLETVFCDRIKETLIDTCLFDFDDWRMIGYLLECFDPDYAKTHFENTLKNDENILKYLDKSVVVWTGNGTEYEINNEYKKYLTKDRVLDAIQAQKTTGDFFILPIKLQNKCCAFYLNSLGEKSYNGNISQSDIDDLLVVWQN